MRKYNITKLAGPMSFGQNIGQAAEGIGKLLETLKKVKGRPSPTVESSLKGLSRTVVPGAIALGLAGVAANRMDKAFDATSSALASAADKAMLDRKIDRMVAIQPSLGEYDRDLVKMYYNMVRHFSPDVAKNDLSAASTVKHNLQLHDAGGPPIVTYEALANTQDKIEGAKPRKRPGIAGASLISGARFYDPTTLDMQAPNMEPFFPKM